MKLKNRLKVTVHRGAETIGTSLDFLDPMPPDDACEQLMDDPTKMWVTLGDIISAFGMTTQELHADLSAGKLMSHMLEGDKGEKTIAVNAQELLRWMTITGRKSKGEEH
jgi:hypothetical protein